MTDPTIFFHNIFTITLNKYLLHNITFMLVYCTNEAVRMCAYIITFTVRKNTRTRAPIVARKKQSNFITISNWNEEDNHSSTRLQDAVSRLTISGAVLNISCDNRQVKNVRSYQLLTYLSTLEFRMYQRRNCLRTLVTAFALRKLYIYSESI